MRLSCSALEALVGGACSERFYRTRASSTQVREETDLIVWRRVEGPPKVVEEWTTMRELSVNAAPLIAEYAFKQACPRDVEM